MNVQAIPSELRALPRWCCWKWSTDGRKVPIDPLTTRWASHSDPATWNTFANALFRLRRGGVGLNFASGGGIVAVDLDHCRDPQTGVLTAFAQDVIARLDTYTEISPSGTGIHLFCLGAKPGPRCRYQADADALELYDGAHFMSVTGEHVPGARVRLCERSDVLSRLYTQLWPPRPVASPRTRPVTPLSDTDLLRVACYSATFRALWAGDLSRYAGNESRADYAFCCSLAGLTRDDAQIARLWANSGLARLPGRWAKWQSRRPAGTYGTGTIHAALLAVAPRAEALA